MDPREAGSLPSWSWRTADSRAGYVPCACVRRTPTGGAQDVVEAVTG